MIAALLLFACSSPGAPPEVAEEAAPASKPTTHGPEVIRVGWQITWATQGQLAAALQKTNIMDMLGFDAEFVGFPYGGPLNEGALSGGVDVIFTADQPAITLMSRSPDWTVIGRLMYNRVGTFVPPDSPIQSPAELKGKRVAIPFGSAAQRETMRAAGAAGLASGEIKPVNLGIQELIALVGAGSAGGRWGEMDAASAWDPTFAELEKSGRARAIASGVVTAVVVMDDRYISAHPGADRRVMEALSMAYDYYRTHTEEADGWFLEASGLSFSPEVLSLAASVEPNLKVEDRKLIRVSLSDEDMAGLQSAADFMAEAGLLKEPFQVGPRVRRQVADKVGQGGYSPPRVVR